MRINYSEKLEKINNDRILMLNTVKENITNGNLSLSKSLDTTIETLNYDEENTKEYKSIVKAKELIFELTEEISKATTIDEVVKLRKRINYYINKIKQEMVRRKISQDTFEQMYSDVVYLRNRIAMYLRFLKREDMLAEMTALYEEIEDLPDDSKDMLKKIMINESKYNKRVLKNIDNVENSVSKMVKRESSKLVAKTDLESEIPFHFVDDQEVTEIIESVSMYLKDVPDPAVEKYLSSRLDRYISLYNFYDLLQYDGNFLQNIINLFRNIPRYRKNRKIIKSAKNDYNVFYHGKDLGAFIDYSKKRNSARTALSAIFKSSRLSKREIECLYNHDKCREWIMEFHDQKNYWYEEASKLVRVK